MDWVGASLIATVTPSSPDASMMESSTRIRGKMLHQRASFSTGLTVPFSRPAFFGPPYATPEEIEVEIARNAGQFAVISKSPSELPGVSAP